MRDLVLINTVDVMAPLKNVKAPNAPRKKYII